MSVPRPIFSPNQQTARRLVRAFPGLQGGRRAGLAPVYGSTRTRRRRVQPALAVEWIQPDDVVLFAEVAYISTSLHESYFDEPDVLRTHNGVALAIYPDNYPICGKNNGAGGWQYVTSVSFFNVAALAEFAVVDPPTIPPGMSVEYEAFEGVYRPGTCTLAGNADSGVVAADPVSETYGASIRRYPRAGYDFDGAQPILPGDADLHDPETNPDIAALYGYGDVLETFPGPASGSVDSSDSFPFDVATDDPDDEGWVGMLALFDGTFAEVLAATGSTNFDYAQVFGMPATLSATFRPPRYRFV